MRSLFMIASLILNVNFGEPKLVNRAASERRSLSVKPIESIAALKLALLSAITGSKMLARDSLSL